MRNIVRKKWEQFENLPDNGIMIGPAFDCICSLIRIFLKCTFGQISSRRSTKAGIDNRYTTLLLISYHFSAIFFATNQVHFSQLLQHFYGRIFLQLRSILEGIKRNKIEVRQPINYQNFCVKLIVTLGGFIPCAYCKNNGNQ